MTLKVGLTGGMGSGKSTVGAIFETLGIPVYYADDAAKKLMNEDGALKAALIHHFGADIYKDGRLDRASLSAKVFNDPGKLTLLNSLVHPATIAYGENWLQQQTTAYAVKEAAIIFESGSQKDLDFIIGVYAPVTLRIFRSMKRNNLTREEVNARMNKQMDDAIKMKLCDGIVTNDEQHAILPQVLALHEQLLKLSKEKNDLILAK